VREAIELRRRFLPPDLTACRMVNGESDGLPGVSVDRYADYLVVHLFTPAVVRLRDAIVDELQAALAPRAIYEQRRTRTLAGEAPRPAELVRGSAAPVEVEVSEGPLRFWVDVTAPLSTGLFLDLRLGRRALAAWSPGRRVLNLFSYTGAISVYAQHGGAREVCAVDISAKAHARARRNFALNGFDPEKPEHIAGDAFKVLARMVERGRKFDLVVLDPPAFGTAGRGQVFSAVQDYRDLVAAALGVLVPGGLLAAASSTHKISHEDFDRMLAEGGARARAPLRILERCWLPPDFCVSPGFPEGGYLKFAIAARD
jgi:23S rRNA (cytosine1962-C5)-methyltransferase